MKKIIIFIFTFVIFASPVFAQVMDDEQKLQAIKDIICEKAETIQTLEQMETFLQNIASTQLINFVVNKLNQRAADYDNDATNSSQISDDLEALGVEIDALKESKIEINERIARITNEKSFRN